MDVPAHNPGRMNRAVTLPAGVRRWDSEVAGGRMHVIVDGRVVALPERE